jgi:predicted short-subunit dehydrogenase-like oxidoreductase (DUF2520 family)
MPPRKQIYSIIGDGCVARHFAHYLDLLGIPYSAWSRKVASERQLAEVVADSSHVLVLIKDAAIEDFVRVNSSLKKKRVVHFSGSLVTPLAHGLHPLMTFTHELYSLDKYRVIPFVVEESGLTFQQLLPGLDNPHYYLKRELKPLYHSLCVLSGNFTTVLWDKFFSDLMSRLGIPVPAAFPYLEQITENLKNRESSALSGPLARKDFSTIRSNLQALEGDPFQKVYYGFLEALNLKDQIRGNSR